MWKKETAGGSRLSGNAGSLNWRMAPRGLALQLAPFASLINCADSGVRSRRYCDGAVDRLLFMAVAPPDIRAWIDIARPPEAWRFYELHEVLFDGGRCLIDRICFDEQIG